MLTKILITDQFNKRKVSRMILKQISIIFIVFAGIAWGNGKELLNEKFSSLKVLTSKKGIRKIVKINDLSGFSNALLLRTTKHNGKLNYARWQKSFPGDKDRLVIDYWIKPVDRFSRYGLFIRDSKGKQIVALLFKNNRVVCNNGGAWINGVKYEVGKWQHIRYFIDCITQRYDVFLNNMRTPVCKGYKFRDINVGSPSYIWIESDEAHESTTLLTGVKISGNTSVFPPRELSKQPFFIYGINKVEKGKKITWQNVPEVKLQRIDGQPTREYSTVKLLWDEKNLYVLFKNKALKADLRKHEITGDDAKVWKKGDCFEVFVDPGRSLKNYYHFAGNASKGKYDAKCTFPKKNRKFNSSWKFQTSVNKGGWTAEVAIPFTTLGKMPKAGDIWGFNAGRENNYMKEVSSWFPLDNFHNPKQFGTLIFVDKEYLESQPEDLGKKLAEKIYPLDLILIDIHKQLFMFEKNAKDDGTFKKYKRELSSLKKNISNSKTFTSYFKQFQQAKKLLKNISMLGVEVIRYKKLFAKGSTGKQRGYVVSVEDSMKKVFQNSYIGKSDDSISLSLAGNEYGSFQLFVIPSKKYNINKINVSFSDLKAENGEIIAAANIKSFKVDYVKTIFPSKNQQCIPDVLIDGNQLRYQGGEGIKNLWFDIYIPANTKAGIYRGTIKIKPDNKAITTLKVKIRIYDFSLPKGASLRNVFCFMPFWAEKFYGKKMPYGKRLAYFDFIMQHRLEPVNLWPQTGGLFMTEDELKIYTKKGKNIILLPISRKTEKFKKEVASYLEILQRNDWMDKAVFFGFDEVISSPKGLGNMKKMYQLAKEIAPKIPRLNTAYVDSRLHGYVDIWCPKFNFYDKNAVEQRIAKGEKVWWYPTHTPLAPYANFNLDSPGIDPRIIPWMNWKLNLSGLLYWSINREWKTNGGDQGKISDRIAKLRDINWLTPQIKQKIKAGLRWPEIPWLPVFIGLGTTRVSQTNGGGNLMYPGPDWKPLPSIRLKNLRDGMQDYEYFAMLKKNLEDLKKRNKDIQLIREVESALSLNGNVVQNETSYTKDGIQLLKAKKHIANLIEKTNRVLGK